MIDLLPFCSWRDSKISRPYSIGDWTLATDGAIAVIVARREDVPERAGAPDILALFHCPVGCAWNVPPQVNMPAKAMDLGCSVGLPWGIFAQRYVRLIWSLPSVMVAPGASRFDAMRFQFASGEGLAMPMRTPHARHLVVASPRRAVPDVASCRQDMGQPHLSG